MEKIAKASEFYRLSLVLDISPAFLKNARFISAAYPCQTFI
jgi:hypothetical protein